MPAYGFSMGIYFLTGCFSLAFFGLKENVCFLTNLYSQMLLTVCPAGSGKTILRLEILKF